MKIDGYIDKAYQQIDISNMFIFMYVFGEVFKDIKEDDLKRFTSKIKRR